MIVVGAGAAPEILGRGAAVVIDEALYEASLPELACDRPDQHKRFIRADNCRLAQRSEDKPDRGEPSLRYNARHSVRHDDL
jgi:hypothetical protein